MEAKKKKCTSHRFSWKGVKGEIEQHAAIKRVHSAQDKRWAMIGTPGHLVILTGLTAQRQSPSMTGSTPLSQHNKHR